MRVRLKKTAEDRTRDIKITLTELKLIYFSMETPAVARMELNVSPGGMNSS
jgi:hypothetical protein